MGPNLQQVPSYAAQSSAYIGSNLLHILSLIFSRYLAQIYIIYLDQSSVYLDQSSVYFGFNLEQMSSLVTAQAAFSA